MITIFKSRQYWVKWYVVIQVISRHDINPILPIRPKIDHETIWNFCVIRLLHQASAQNTFYFIWNAILHRLSKCYSTQYKGLSRYLTHDPSRMVEIIGIWNNAFHEPIPDNQLNILWQNAISHFYIFNHQQVNFSLGWMLERFTRWSRIDHSESCSFVRCGFLPSSCISQSVNMVIIYKQYKLRTHNFSNPHRHDLRLEHVLIFYCICH